MSTLDRPDFQAVAPAGSNSPYPPQSQSLTSGQQITAGALLVANYNSLLISVDKTVLQAGTVTVEWSNTPAGPYFAALAQEWPLYDTNPGLWVIPVLGAYVTVIVHNTGAATETVTAGVFGIATGATNKQVLGPQLLVEEVGVTVNHGARSEFYPSVHTGGTFQVWLGTFGGQPCSAGVEVWDGTNWQQLVEIAQAANLDGTFSWLLPNNHCRFYIQNTGPANAAFSLMVTGPTP